MRLPIGIALIVAGASFVPLIYGDGNVGSDYWKYYVPALIVGSAGIAIGFLGIKCVIASTASSSFNQHHCSRAASLS
jgi:hypothetical protein